MHASASACCIATCIAALVSLIILLCLSLLYWTIPRVPATAHDFVKVTADRFASAPSDALLIDAMASAADMTNILMSWHSPLCGVASQAARHGSFFHDASANEGPRFHVQYWVHGSWLSGFAAFNQASPESSVDGGDLYSDDCFVVLENVKHDATYSLRVRSRVDTALFQIFSRQWTAWTDAVLVPPFVPESACEGSWFTRLFAEESWYTDRRTLALVAVTAGSLFYAMALAKRRVRPTGDMKLLEEEVTNLKQELADAEMENKLLMRLKGYDIDFLDIADIEALEAELTLGLQRIAEAKDAMI
ncbi:hypothetical protein SPRG_01985 [Saprolegnia parasitica CBS 223.65]|uniref:Uncharacterized protein n=1 Tax=Saprolegnia parasitica (strain CBS 223.65) TaxID=695850 RepID=A0A067CRS7_SAPPC|nr:hypothetical protein SPRG_01985 [Saprolegnia parasitica CBS 223.65]KDO33173.1 hypothetical protein SPRG_01985 [Saprolegnia parasitica CBS 223.65]|eukprot:XP_012195936.1 hypothetical protein SPRG_01985 [Saprolegnia parasitica CBS 223.65]